MTHFFRFEIRIKGFVQGIGFRPFVYKLAIELGLKGWVNNDTEGVNIVIESNEAACSLFLQRLKGEKPALAEIKDVQIQKTPCLSPQYLTFEIRESQKTQSYAADVLPDLVTCPDCLSEVMDPKNRRYRYVFTNCTYCGPRFSIIQNLPYDRGNTTMASFLQCEACLGEYTNPLDRRFHAQPNACHDCGPRVSLMLDEQCLVSEDFKALEDSAQALKEGRILALKGIGGYQLVVDAKNPKSVAELRRRKQRARKPFAVMMGSLDEAKAYCRISADEATQMKSVAAPIVLVEKNLEGDVLTAEVAPNNPYLGIFLPNTPLHHWLLRLFGGPLVVTSANLSDEPLTYSEPEVYVRLKGIADLYLVHNRPIARPIDDSVVQVVEGQIFVLRAARGFAPMSFEAKSEAETFATGPHMKTSFALQTRTKMILGQHLGEMESDKGQDLFESEFLNYEKFYHWQPRHLVHDAHPNYFTTDWAQTRARQTAIRCSSVQHHRAHIFSAFVENEIRGSFLGVAWDGTGYGDDGVIWGGEFFQGAGTGGELRRVAHCRPFPLLGGEAAVRAPWRVALALLLEVDDDLAKEWFRRFHSEKNGEIFEALRHMAHQKLNAPMSTSVGRLMEGVSSLLGIVQENEFDADAAMQLEFVAKAARSRGAAQPPLRTFWDFTTPLSEWDWRKWIEEAATQVLGESSADLWAFDLHQHLINAVFEMAEYLGERQIILGGGVFQNRELLSGILQQARAKEIKIFTPHRVPLNDGGIAIGQLVGSVGPAAGDGG